MKLQLCVLVNYLYRRDVMPRSYRWHMQPYQVTSSPEPRVPGLVDHERSADELSITIAVPCSPGGEVTDETQAEYEDLADDRFRHLQPDEELA